MDISHSSQGSTKRRLYGYSDEQPKTEIDEKDELEAGHAPEPARAICSFIARDQVFLMKGRREQPASAYGPRQTTQAKN